MSENKPYKCVNCGEASAALYKTYGPSVLKLTKCSKCNGIVDKYIEYDPVIVMIDLVLVSREAQRHVLYNTEFKAYWKLFIILVMIETYGLWQSDSLFNIVVNAACGIDTNSTTFNMSELATLARRGCAGWRPAARDDRDLFIWEKHFYIQFISTFTGVIAFILTLHCAMKLLKKSMSQNEVHSRINPLGLTSSLWFLVHFTSVLKAYSLAAASGLLALPALVWGADPAPEAKALHYGLVFVYSFAVQLNTFIVLYGCPLLPTAALLVASNGAKFLTTYHTTPIIRDLLT